MEMQSSQIKGVDSTIRETKRRIRKNAHFIVSRKNHDTWQSIS